MNVRDKNIRYPLNSEDNTSLWTFFTKKSSIRCINLVTRKDRYQQSQEVFDKHGIPVKYFFANRHPNGGAQGCYESHISCINESYLRGDEMCLIFEDDVLPCPNTHNIKILKEAIRFMKLNQTWELFYFGTHHNIWSSKTQKVSNLFPSILKIKSICTHAYVIHRRLMERMFNSKYMGIAIDYIYVNNNNAYGIYPSMFYQRLSPSDISSSWNSFPLKLNWFWLVDVYSKYINKPINSIAYVLSFGFLVLVLLILIKPNYSRLFVLIICFITLILILKI